VTHTPRTPRKRRRSAPLLRVCLLVALLALAVPALSVTPAAAATIDCPNLSSDACKNTVPIAECAWSNGDGTTSFVWGWDNPSTDTAHAAAGSAQNRITPGSAQPQPELFGPGRHQNAFWTTSSGTSATWRLGNTAVTATSGAGGTTPTCATKPVPQVGSIGVLAVAVGLAGMAALLVVATRPRRRPVEVR
jgi:hypothetical protein